VVFASDIVLPNSDSFDIARRSDASSPESEWRGLEASGERPSAASRMP
jgi:hypothetical protein